MKRNKIKNFIQSLLRAVLYVIMLAAICVSTYNITYKLLEYKDSADTYNDYADKYVTISETPKPAKDTPKPIVTQKPESTTVPQQETDHAEEDETELIEDEPSEKEDPDTLYTDEQFPISVDFDALLQDNGDIVGWIYCPDTKINYPVVRGEDNDFYLHRKIDKEYSYGGSIFLDASNRRDWSSRNNILYGHNMNDGSMFHSIIKYKQQEHYDKQPYMYLSTPEGNYRLDIFAGFVTESESEVYSTFFTSNDSFITWYKKMQDKSSIQTEYKPCPTSRILMLSTCTYERENMRYVLMMVMRPIASQEPQQNR